MKLHTTFRYLLGNVSNLLWAVIVTLLACVGNAAAQTPSPTPSCARTLTAKVVALNQVITYNRLGAVNPNGLMYALERDIETISPTKGVVAGNVRLRADKRPRPIALRMNVGDCLQILFKNLIAPGTAFDLPGKDDQPLTPNASVHVAGLQLVNNITDDGSNVGAITPPGGLVAPNGNAVYTLFAEREGNHLLYSTGTTTGGEGDGGTLAYGLFGSVNVEPKGSQWYRSQVTAEDLKYATKKNASGATLTAPGGQPLLDYEARYPATHPKFPNKPVLNMLDGNEIVHTDLNAVITGAGRKDFPAGTYPQVAIEPQRDQSFREFTVVYHDEIKAVQAFPQFDEEDPKNPDPSLAHTLHSVRDGFGINYGVAGIGAEILANRLKVGPMYNCPECKYEEFFLSAWAIGDPAQLVDVPANATDVNGNLITGPKATKVFFPDDPSNVHHSYMNDHLKMRVVHAGPKEHHVHHLHAHQWIRTPDSDESVYLDSQALGPGYSFTTEIANGGSGNKNRTVGDSIFHCHFYPHFAQGMWELWRVHDVFEAGTQLDANGRPAPGSRALPDGEIAAGTPIPSLVPIPTRPMAPMPTANFQGYPFFIPGVAGHRPPHPPLDTVDTGGLTRHVITAGTYTEVHNRLDFSKELLTVNALQVPENGTTSEQSAMQFHGTRIHPSTTQEGISGDFITNGLPRKTAANPLGSQPGSPYADPCMDKDGNAVGDPRTYKAADIQLDIKLNKVGWHMPQSRILALWQDVGATLNGARAPEPFFFRANTNDCIVYHHTNLVPHNYELDDFQVRTPTDIMGQHIHLVKFDVTSSDGAGNGWNYEDGTFAPGEVQERIRAIRKGNGCLGKDSGDPADGTFKCPVAKAHPFFGLSGHDDDGNGLDDWLGAQTTIQRWFADPVLDNNGNDRTLNTVFTHDHFGPSTHQQTGLYAGLIVEKRGAQWKQGETGVPFYTRPDGGPTSWQALITFPSDPSQNFREFALEFADFQLAYEAGGGFDAKGRPAPDPARVINPPVKDEVGLPYLVEKANQCPDGSPLPCPEAVSASDPGTMSVNYRNEPLALRVFNPATQAQAAGSAGDLSHAYRSLTNRSIGALNTQPTFYPKLTQGVQPGDPFTPLLRVFENDKVKIRVLVGAHEEGHNFSIHGLSWLFEQDERNSGYRNNQMMGISEHYEFVVPPLPVLSGDCTDFLYMPGSATDDQWNGLWGIMRAYRGTSATSSATSKCGKSQSGSGGGMTANSAANAGSADQLSSADAPAQTEPNASATMTDTAVAPVDEVTLDPSAEGPLETMENNPDGQGPDVDAFNTDEKAADGDPNANFSGASGATPQPQPAPAPDPTVQPAPGTTTITTDNTSGRTFTATPSGTSMTSSGSTADGDTYTTNQTASGNSGVPVCPQDAPVRKFSVAAISAQMALPKGTLYYNSRNGYGGKLHDPTAIMYVRSSDLDGFGRLKAGVPTEPLVLRARAGECIELTLANKLPNKPADLAGFDTLPMLIQHFNANQVRPSNQVGLHPQLLRYDVRTSNGVNVGLNPLSTISPTDAPITYRWYAGRVINFFGYIVGLPIEFGATSLSPSDPIKHASKGAIGSLVIEPRYATWTVDNNSRAAASVAKNDGSGEVFREFVTFFQNNLNLRSEKDVNDKTDAATWAGSTNIPTDAQAANPEASAASVGTTYGNGGADASFVNAATGKNTGYAIMNLAEAEDPEDSGQKAFNYRTEPLWNRMGFAPNTPLHITNNNDFTNVLSNTQVGGDPVTPIFRANPRQPVRFRVVMPGGHARNNVFMVHGHIWEEEPFILSSTKLGSNPTSEWKGSYYGIGALSHFNFLLKNGAGGKSGVSGDYLYRSFHSFGFDGGLWGIFRVNSAALPPQVADPQ